MNIEKFLSKLTSGQTLTIMLVAIILPSLSSFAFSYIETVDNKEMTYKVNENNIILNTIISNDVNNLDYRASLFVMGKTTNASKNALLRELMIILSNNHIEDEERRHHIKTFLRNKTSNLYKSDVNKLKMFSYKGMSLSQCLNDINPVEVSEVLYMLIANGYDNKPQLRRDLINYLDVLFDDIDMKSDMILLHKQRFLNI